MRHAGGFRALGHGCRRITAGGGQRVDQADRPRVAGQPAPALTTIHGQAAGLSLAASASLIVRCRQTHQGGFSAAATGQLHMAATARMVAGWSGTGAGSVSVAGVRRVAGAFTASANAGGNRVTGAGDPRLVTDGGRRQTGVPAPLPAAQLRAASGLSWQAQGGGQDPAGTHRMAGSLSWAASGGYSATPALRIPSGFTASAGGVMALSGVRRIQGGFSATANSTGTRCVVDGAPRQVGDGRPRATGVPCQPFTARLRAAAAWSGRASPGGGPLAPVHRLAGGFTAAGSVTGAAAGVVRRKGAVFWAAAGQLHPAGTVRRRGGLSLTSGSATMIAGRRTTFASFGGHGAATFSARARQRHGGSWAAQASGTARLAATRTAFAPSMRYRAAGGWVPITPRVLAPGAWVLPKAVYVRVVQGWRRIF